MNTTQPRYAVRRVLEFNRPSWAVIVPPGAPDLLAEEYASRGASRGVKMPSGRTVYPFGRGPSAWREAVAAVFDPLEEHETPEEQPRPFDGVRNWLAGKTPPTTQTFTITDPDAVRAIAALFDDDDQQPAPATREEFVEAVADGVERALERRDERIRDTYHARVDAYVMKQLARPGGMEELNAQGIYPVTGPEPAHTTHDADWRPIPHVIHDRDCDEWQWDNDRGQWIQLATGTADQWRGPAMVERGPFHAHRAA